MVVRRRTRRKTVKRKAPAYLVYKDSVRGRSKRIRKMTRQEQLSTKSRFKAVRGRGLFVKRGKKLVSKIC